VQVERRFATNETFGQNRTASRQVLMTITDFIDKLKKNDGDLLYLSTQESESDDWFQVPCRQLLYHECIASHVPWAGNLILYSCNLVRLLLDNSRLKIVLRLISHARSGWERREMAPPRDSITTITTTFIF
jgi:hypothetical protein